MASIRFQRRHNPLKARLLAPFVPKYRLRSRIAAMPEPIQLIIRQVVLSDDNRLLFVRNFKSGCTTVSHLIYERDKGHRYEGNISDAPDLIRGSSGSGWPTARGDRWRSIPAASTCPARRTGRGPCWR